jgi:hypothetical protein
LCTQISRHCACDVGESACLCQRSNFRRDEADAKRHGGEVTVKRGKAKAEAPDRSVHFCIVP